MQFPAEASDVATIGSKFEETFKSKNYEQMKQLFTDDVWSLHSNMSRTETNDGTDLFSVGVSETVQNLIDCRINFFSLEMVDWLSTSYAKDAGNTSIDKCEDIFLLSGRYALSVKTLSEATRLVR